MLKGDLFPRERPLDEKSLELLEFPKIRERIAALASFSGGRELALALLPSSDHASVARSHQEWLEARRLLELRASFGLGGVHDVRPAAEQARLGGVLTTEQLQDVRDTLQGARTLQDTVARLKDQLPVLWEAIGSLPDCRALQQEIDRCVGPRGEVLDGSSPLLARLRTEARSAHDRLQDRLTELLTSSRYRTMLQEPIITLRNGRYVMPVKADFRGEFRGIVHDLSSSGATVFMEPLATIDLGNRWRELQLEEEREVARVLRQLSIMVGDYAPEVVASVEVLARMDLALAKARYGQQVRGIAPHLEAGSSDPPPEGAAGWPALGPLALVEARHPLLTGHVVPISLELAADFYALVITGPNTGGKTVALKTAGLLVLMAEAGVPVPAAQGTRIPLYPSVFADIGDEQSIEQSLSTFSSHMSNIIRILGTAGNDSLVLLDELGAGTDPTEGSALGRAILRRLLEHHVSTIATTHHNDLKAFAYNTPWVRNASVEFDAGTLSPTYRLTVGLPGRSNAIAIAERLGLPGELVAQARGFLEPEQLQAETLLEQLQREKDLAASLRQEAEELRRAADEARRRWSARLQEVDAAKEQMLEEARSQLAAEAETLQRSLREAARQVEQALRERRREELVAAAQTAQETEAALAGPRWQPPRRRRARQLEQPLRLAPGTQVRLRGLGQTAEVVSAPDAPEEEVEVQIGAFRAKVRRDQLEAAEGDARPWPSPGWAYALGSPDLVEPELHLRGLRVEEALTRLDEYLDTAFRGGLPWVRVIHGKGTGAMRRAVREALTRHPLVRSFESPGQEQGGEGVTVAHLAQ
ncbi:MAG: endonuclease MutS2 [Chloroflexi bacterium]|nr:endonuclease MutS2 [Chloroflexota bacterium]